MARAAIATTTSSPRRRPRRGVRAGAGALPRAPLGAPDRRSGSALRIGAPDRRRLHGAAPALHRGLLPSTADLARRSRLRGRNKVAALGGAGCRRRRVSAARPTRTAGSGSRRQRCSEPVPRRRRPARALASAALREAVRGVAVVVGPPARPQVPVHRSPPARPQVRPLAAAAVVERLQAAEADAAVQGAEARGRPARAEAEGGDRPKRDRSSSLAWHVDIRGLDGYGPSFSHSLTPLW